MERLGERDRVLLGHAYRDPFGNIHHPPPPHRNSDVDFADVFGGPPRRSSLYERRRSRADSLDLRPPSSGQPPEKPAFGELGSPAQRRLLGEDFFDDIFPGSDSGSSSPRKLDRDPFASAPGSRVLSPNRPVFVGGSSLQAQFSLPKTKLAKGVDHLPFDSPTQNSTYKSEDGDSDASSFPYSPNASRAVPAQDDLKKSSHGFYRQSPLASRISHGTVRSSENFNKSSQSERYATSLDGYISSNQFHFSMYKWASKGVSLSLSSLSKGTNDISRYSRLPEVIIHAGDLPSDDDNMSTSTGASDNQTENKDAKILNDISMESKHEEGSAIREDVLPESDPKYLSRTSTGNSGMVNNNTEEVSVAKPGTKRPELKNLHQLSQDDIDKDDGGHRDVNDDVNVEQQAQRHNSAKHVNMKDIPISTEDKMQGNRVKGRVKEFIKIFNLEGSPKRKGIFDSGDRKSKGKDRVKSKVEVQVSIYPTEADEVVKVAPTNEEGTFVIDSVEVIETLKSGIPNFYMSSNVPMAKDSSQEKNNNSGPRSASTLRESVKDSVYNVEDLDGCLVEQLSQEQTETQQAVLNQDQIKIADAKIQEWSKGKEGNIRSLLSTLQYVLWSESGWKPIPLVDIIEGPAVKRAYQKALLCLHPDKLQQRGAAEHQKYIAEKVFDILQEAWDQFSQISTGL